MIARIFLAVLVVAVAAVLFLSDRPWHLSSTPRVDEVALVPDTSGLADVRRYTEVGLAQLPYMARQARPGTARPPLKLGWSYRELSLLRMPFWASNEVGYVTYLEFPDHIRIAMLSPAQISRLEQQTGHRFTQDYSFPWHRHLWGWLLFVGLIIWTLLWRREANLAEEARWAA